MVCNGTTNRPSEKGLFESKLLIMTPNLENILVSVLEMLTKLGSTSCTKTFSLL